MKIFDRVLSLFRRTPRADELDREVAFHLEELTAANIRQGISESEARRLAALAFGGREQIGQSLRDVHASVVLESLAMNGRAALRFLRRSPMFSLCVATTLAFGIGANSVVFSAVDAVLLRPLPFADADRLVQIEQANLRNLTPETHVAPLRLEDWNRLSKSFTAISGFYTQDVTSESGSAPERLSEAIVAPRFFQVLGAAPFMGRYFSRSEEHFGGPAAVVLRRALLARTCKGWRECIECGAQNR